MPLEAQAALEAAVVNALLTGGGPGGAAIPTGQVRRMYDGQPPPIQGNVFYAVWYDGQRPNHGKRTVYEELFGVYVTITIRFTQPFDRWLIHRDDLEQRANALKALVIGQDMYNCPIIRAANTLAGFQSSGSATPGPRGWVEPLFFEGYDAKQDVGPDWFHAETEANKGLPVGIAQRIRFGQAKRIQKVFTATN